MLASYPDTLNREKYEATIMLNCEIIFQMVCSGVIVVAIKSKSC